MMCTMEAPRDNASKPIAPEPPNKSNTCSPKKSPNSERRDENNPSRARSDVGLVAPATVPKVRPLATPAMILNFQPLSR